MWTAEIARTSEASSLGIWDLCCQLQGQGAYSGERNIVNTECSGVSKPSRGRNRGLAPVYIHCVIRREEG